MRHILSAVTLNNKYHGNAVGLFIRLCHMVNISVELRVMSESVFQAFAHLVNSDSTMVALDHVKHAINWWLRVCPKASRHSLQNNTRILNACI